MNDVEGTAEKGMNPQVDEQAQAGPAAEGAASELLQQLAHAQAQAAEYLDSWRRATAELSNARKRMAREQEELRATAAGRVLEKLLPVLDDMDRAFASAPAGPESAEWINGFRMIQRKLEGVLESEGVKPISTAGAKFDPAIHYAVTHEEADGYPEGAVIAEVARGYLLGDKVLRPAMVRVARGTDS